MYKWGKNSERRMSPVNNYLVDIAYEAIGLSKVDMTIPWMGGFRTAFEQNEIFLNKNSKADGYKKKSYHQSGNAIDIIPYINGEGTYKAYSESVHIASIVLTIFDYNKLLGEIPDNKFLHWGGFWGAEDLNGDGILNSFDDNIGWDIAHFEIRNRPQKRVLTLIV
jgi:peptidoglycan L-alanyl-D-glutamate endopeptidase CwlK